MDSKQFKEYKAIIEEAIRQAGLTENYTIHEPVPGDDAGMESIFVTTNRSKECLLVVDGPAIHILKRVRHPQTSGGYSFIPKESVNLAHPDGVIQLGRAIKSLLMFSYLSSADDL
jgi:hypothetical protein